MQKQNPFPYLLFTVLAVDILLKICWMFDLIWAPVYWWAGTAAAVVLTLCKAVARPLKEATDDFQKEKPLVKSFIPAWVVVSIVSVFVKSPV